MRNIWVFAMAIVAVQGCNREHVTETNADLLIKDVTVVSVGHEMTSVATDVLVRDGKIVFIGNLDADSVSDARTTIDGTNRFLIPGLIDSHTHLSEVPGMTFEHERLFPDVSSEARNQIPRSYLYHGFTTVIDLNSHPQAIDDWNS